MICPNCHAEVAEGAFCEECGSPLNSAPQPTQPVQQPAQQPVQQPVQSQPAQQMSQSAYGQAPSAYPPQTQQPYQQPYPSQPQYPGQQPKGSGGKVVGIVIAIVIVLAALGFFAWSAISEMFGFGGGKIVEEEMPTSSNVVNGNTAQKPSPSDENTEAKPAEPAKPAEETTTSNANKTTDEPKDVPQGMVAYDTTAMATLADMYWLTDPMIANGTLPSGVEKMDPEDAVGGWKLYIIARVADSVDYLGNCRIAGPASSGAATITWDKAVIGGTTKDANTPPSDFTGPLTGKMTGPGAITFEGFWERDGHQYGIGTFMWPDGEKATVALVRP